MSDCRLYLITPPSFDIAVFTPRLAGALEGGDVAALQVRLKDADEAAITAAVRAVTPLTRRHGVALILNDDPELAARLACDGVHVGQGDTPLAQARRVMGASAMIGVTCHDSRHLAMEAADAGADYVAFGAFFPTGTKLAPTTADPEILSIWQETMQTPCVAIGGITVQTAASLAQAGADFLAVSAGVWAYPAGPAQAVADFNTAMRTGVALRS
jgi:thiamine-phosphate pyrophosphorylase